MTGARAGARTGRSRRAAAGATGALVLALAAGAAAQTAGEVTPSTFRPDLQRLGGAVVFSGEPGLEAPAGAEALSVTLSDVVIEGGLPQMAATNAAVEDRLTGQPIPVSEIFAAAQDLEAAYAREGFVLSRVVLPAQTLRDGGSLRLVVVNGFVERVDTTQVPEPLAGRVRRITEPLVGRRGLRLVEIERRLLLAGDTPGTALTSALTTGEAPGGTILAVEGEFRPVTGFVGVNNTLSDELGRTVIEAGVDVNNPFGRGEAFYLRAFGHFGGEDEFGRGGFFDDDPRVRTFAGGVIVPLGTEGLAFNLEATRSETTTEPSDGQQTASEFDRLSLRLSYPWIRSRSLNLTSQIGFDVQSEEVELLDEVDRNAIFEDDLRVLRLSAELDRLYDDGGFLEAGAIISFGLDALGARSAEDAEGEVPLSRSGADADFRTLEVQAGYTRPVAEHLAFSLYGRAQTSFGDPVVGSEQIGIASFGEISAFGSGTLTGDSGWVVRGDLLSPWDLQAGAFPVRFTPYAYAAAGALHLEEPTAQEEQTVRVSSYGLGVELTSIIDPSFSAATLALEVARGFRDDDEDDESRFSLVGTIRF